METAERARGRLYGFHRLTGTADFALDRAARLLREAGHRAWADRVETEIPGRDAMSGHWTYQIVDASNETSYEPFRHLERTAVAAPPGGREHRFEPRLRRERRTPGHPGRGNRRVSPAGVLPGARAVGRGRHPYG
ncbi:hypothetical protein [Streptomyces sp. NPDC004520]|uniref:hypothetical protein n=1 Tax=unclassified Streptomyces TaxID=2593676 RepID=UPI0036836F66